MATQVRQRGWRAPGWWKTNVAGAQFRDRVQVTLTVALLLLSHASWAGEVFPNLPFRFKDAACRQVSLAYEPEDNCLLVTATLNGFGPYNLLLDTGVAASTILDPELGQLLAPEPTPGRSCQVGGVGMLGTVVAFRAEGVRVDFGGIEAPALPFVVLTGPTAPLATRTGKPIHGILGYDLFRSFVIAVQPVAGRLLFAPPTTPAPPQGHQTWTQLPLAINDSKPYLSARLTVATTDTGTVPVSLVLDTGAGHALSVELATDPRLRMPAARHRADLGLGQSGPIRGYEAHVASLQLGSYLISGVLTSFPDSSNYYGRATWPRNGTLGFGLLSFFDMVIDYSHNRLLLRPCRRSRQVPLPPLPLPSPVNTEADKTQLAGAGSIPTGSGGGSTSFTEPYPAAHEDRNTLSIYDPL